METLINIGIIIGILIIVVIGIKLLLLIIASALCIWAETSDSIQDRRIKKIEKKREKQSEKNREKAAEIIEILEDFLSKYDVKIPNDDREGNEDEACIYGSDYYDLEDQIVEILDEKG